MGNNQHMVDTPNVKLGDNEKFFVEESMYEESEFYGELYDKKPKVCPSGHHLKEVPVHTRQEESGTGYGRWICSSCRKETFSLEGTRFRCDHHKVRSQLDGSVVCFRSPSRGGMECEYDLCGECFYTNTKQTDIEPISEENIEYRKEVIENIKTLLLEHSKSGIYERNFTGMYREAFGEKIDFQKLGYPAQKSNKSKLLQSLSGSVLEMAYTSFSGKVDLYIKPSKLLLCETAQSQAATHSLLDALEMDENVLNFVDGVRKQVQYPPSLKEGDSLDICVTEVVSPAKFWFQLKGQENSDALENLMNDMEVFYRNDKMNYRLDSGNPHHMCKPGAIMAAPYRDNESHDFHRVHINKICKQNVNKVEVFYLDYGTIERIPISCVRILHEQFRKLPAQALEGKLWGLGIPEGGRTWPKQSAGRFLSCVAPLNKAGIGCYSIVKRIQNDTSSRVLHLELIDAVTNNYKEGVCINQLLVQEGLARNLNMCQDLTSIPPVLGDASTNTEENRVNALKRLAIKTEKEATSDYSTYTGSRTSISAAAIPLFTHCKASDKNGNDEAGNRKKESPKLDHNQNLFNEIENMEEGATTNNNNVAGIQTKFSVNRINITENLGINLLDDSGNIWISSGEISSIIPTWRGRDLLANMLKSRKNHKETWDIAQDGEKVKFEQLMNLEIKPTENLKNEKIFQLYRFSDVSELITMFYKNGEEAKKMILAIDVAAGKVKHDSVTLQGACGVDVVTGYRRNFVDSNSNNTGEEISNFGQTIEEKLVRFGQKEEKMYKAETETKQGFEDVVNLNDDKIPSNYSISWDTIS